jgi:threonine aldolase
LRSPEHAYRIARLLEEEISRIPGVKVVWKVEADGVFVQLPRQSIEKAQAELLFLYLDLLYQDRGGIDRALDVLLRHHRRRYP